MKKIIPVIILIIVALFIFNYLNNKSAKTSQQKSKQIAASSNKSLTKVKVAYFNSSIIEASLGVGLKKGFFEKYGLNVEPQKVNKAISTAITSKQVDIAIDAPSTFIMSKANGGANIFTVGEATSDTPFVLVSYKEPKDIKNIAIPRIGGELYLRAIEALKSLGINQSSVNFQVSGSIEASTLMLSQKKVDATMLMKPQWMLFKKRNNISNDFKILVDTSKEKDLRNPMIIIVSGDYLIKNKKIIQDFSKAILETNSWIKSSNEKEVARALEGFDNLNYDEALILIQTYKYALEDLHFAPDVKKMDEITKSLGTQIKTKNFDVKSFISFEISDSLQKDGFLSRLGF